MHRTRGPGARCRRAAAALAAVAALAVPIAGCGGDEKQTYRSEYAKAADEFKRAAERAAEQARGKPRLRDRIPALRAFRASIDELAKDLDELDPPENVERLNDDAVDALRTLSDDLGKLEDAARANDVAAVRRLTPKLQLDQAELQTTLDAIDQRLGRN